MQGSVFQELQAMILFLFFWIELLLWRPDTAGKSQTLGSLQSRSGEKNVWLAALLSDAFTHSLCTDAKIIISIQARVPNFLTSLGMLKWDLEIQCPIYSHRSLGVPPDTMDPMTFLRIPLRAEPSQAGADLRPKPLLRAALLYSKGIQLNGTTA